MKQISSNFQVVANLVQSGQDERACVRACVRGIMGGIVELWN